MNRPATDRSHRAARKWPVASLLAITSGILLGLSFPSANLWPLALIALAPLLIAVVRSRSIPAAFFYGWLAVTISWLITVPWVITVMTRYGGLALATGVILYAALAIVLGIYGGIFSAAVYLARPDERFRSWLVAPIAWAAIEYARTHLLTGFPWNLLGTTVVDLPQLAILAAWAGPYALGALLVLGSTTLAWMVATQQGRLVKLRTAGAVAVVFIVVLVAGAVALPGRRSGGSGVSAAMIQPNISQEMRWDMASVVTIFDRMMSMSRTAAAGGARVIVWPESTVPLSFASTDFYRDSVEQLSRELRVDVILGSVAEDAADPSAIWNSAYLVTGGESRARYDKIRLVPFGEYVPLRKVLFFAERLVRAVGEFRFGASAVPLAGERSYGPAICYEVVFPQLVAEQTSNGADVLVTITNDAWFGHSSAPVQHLNSVRLRAIENDRWILRAATTGISALIDPAGRIVESLPLDAQGIVQGTFEEKSTRTLYVRFGDWFAVAAWIALAAVILARRRKVQE